MAKKRSSKIGGQAVMEGVMMRGIKSVATAVRAPDGDIVVESKRLPSKTPWWKKIPILRGAINFFMMLVEGMKILLRSAEVYGEEEPSEFEKKVAKKFKVNLFDIALWVGVVLGVGLAIFLFIMLPEFITTGLKALFSWSPHAVIENLIRGVIRMLIFLVYIILTSLVKDVKRVYMYHGAEHKTITCFEEGKELTIENVRGCKKVHDRCGTTFMFIVMAISIVFFSILGALGIEGGTWINILLRLALMPIVAGISYEVLKGLAKFDNPLVRMLKAPGLFLQKFTTREPDDGMIEVAITSFKTVQEMDEDENVEEKRFNIDKNFTLALMDVHNRLRKNKSCDYKVDAEWIISSVLGISRSEVKALDTISENDLEEVKQMVERRAKGEPLQYILGEQDFLNARIKCDNRALIPRFETEFMVDLVIKQTSHNAKLLDLCTGSGAIAVATKLQRPDCTITASDISDDALSLASENALQNGVEIDFVKSDMFENLVGEWDTIVSNPPYITKSQMKRLSREVKLEPQLALYGGVDGLNYYRTIAREAHKRLKSGGMLFLEVGKGQAYVVADMLVSNYHTVEVLQDLDGVDRIVRAIKR